MYRVRDTIWELIIIIYHKSRQLGTIISMRYKFVHKTVINKYYQKGIIKFNKDKLSWTKCSIIKSLDCR